VVILNCELKIMLELSEQALDHTMERAVALITPI
jgi:hypothetical protein